MVQRFVFLLVAVIFLPFGAAADEQVPIKNASELKGSWAGSGGFGPFGQTVGGALEYRIKEDGTYTGVLRPRTGPAVNFQGALEANADGSVASASTGSTATWRLFNVNGRRVLRFEGRNRNTGQATWGEITEDK